MSIMTNMPPNAVHGVQAHFQSGNRQSEEDGLSAPHMPKRQATPAEVPDPRQPERSDQEVTRPQVEDVEAKRARLEALRAWYGRARTDREDFCGD